LIEKRRPKEMGITHLMTKKKIKGKKSEQEECETDELGNLD
jgi:hypothetical protein